MTVRPPYPPTRQRYVPLYPESFEQMLVFSNRDSTSKSERVSVQTKVCIPDLMRCTNERWPEALLLLLSGLKQYCVWGFMGLFGLGLPFYYFVARYMSWVAIVIVSNIIPELLVTTRQFSCLHHMSMLCRSLRPPAVPPQP